MTCLLLFRIPHVQNDAFPFFPTSFQGFYVKLHLLQTDVQNCYQDVPFFYFFSCSFVYFPIWDPSNLTDIYLLLLTWTALRISAARMGSRNCMNQFSLAYFRIVILVLQYNYSKPRNHDSKCILGDLFEHIEYFFREERNTENAYVLWHILINIFLYLLVF